MAGSTGTASFGELLRRYRGAARLTQEELAARSGLSLDAIGMLERGARQTPRARTIDLLVEALDLGPAERDSFVAAARRRAASHGGRSSEREAGIPPELTAHFVGREAELSWLHRQLQHGGRVSVHGLGGIGKSQLVLRYLHGRRADYCDGIFWLRSDREASLLGDLAGLAWRLQLPEREVSEQERQIEAVLRRLRELRHWVLVLDNLEPEAMVAVRRWLPQDLAGHILVTSRTPVWSARLGLTPLPLATASRFLLERTGQADGQAAAAVADALGCLPLALEQAAAFIEASGRDLASYAGLLRTRLVELMGEGIPEGYPKSVATTWQLSFEHVQQERPVAVGLMRLCAFLAPDDIPISLLQAGARELPAELQPAVADELELDRMVTALRRYSLVERQGDSLRVHRLVQAVIRESLGVDERRTWLATAIRLLQRALPDEPDEQPEDWPLCARLLAHVRVAADLAEVTTEPHGLGAILDRAGAYLRARGEFRLAVDVLERALAVREQVLGLEHLDVAASLSHLAFALTRLDELDAARPLQERALQIRERVLEPDHPDIAESIDRLAVIFHEKGDLGAARSLYERASGIRERVLGPEHIETTESLNNLAVLLLAQGEPHAARVLHERVLAVRERMLGPDHPRTTASLNNLAMAFRDLDELATARGLLERAVASKERVLGPDHPATATSLNNLALTLRDLGELDAALQLSERVVTILERTLGPDHPKTAVSHQHLGQVLQLMGNQPAALAYLERAFATLERVRGSQHPLTTASRRALDEITMELAADHHSP